MNKTIVVNLYGSPGAGKSTIAARLFSDLKLSGIKCELVTEYAKDLTWEESFKKLGDQVYVFGKQQHKLWRLKDKVDVIITDSPILLSLVYGSESTPKSFINLVNDVNSEYENINIFLNRKHEYETVGRYHNEEESNELSDKIKNCVLENGQEFHLIMDSKILNITKITDIIFEKIK